MGEDPHNVHTAPYPSLSLIEFPADDPAHARRFWTELLGVELQAREPDEGEGWQTHSDGPTVGVHERGRGPGDTFSLAYFTVSDMAEAVAPIPVMQLLHLLALLAMVAMTAN